MEGLQPHNLQDLIQLGRDLDQNHSGSAHAAANLLWIRNRDGEQTALNPNEAQQQFEAHRGRHNIILKARQMGITTWIAGRFFLRTITRPGTLTLQVAHTRESAQSLFRVVQRMWESLPEDLKEGPLKRSRSNVRQMIFPALDSEFCVASASELNAGRGLSVQNLHCSEVARWPGNAHEKLAGLRAALSPTGELVLESTPNGAYGAFYDEWMAATGISQDRSSNLVRHFLPWWLEPSYIAPPLDIATLRDDELSLHQQRGLTLAQLAYRRSLEHSYGGLRSQEFAEDAATCFRATGACCFSIDAIETRLTELGTPLESRRNGVLLVWFKPQPGARYIVAVDTAGGGPEGDFAAIQVVDQTTGLQCAELQQRITPAETARAAAELAREYNAALIAVERNNHGGSVIAYLESSERYTYLYEQQGKPGWLTTSASKPEMIAHLGVMLAERPASFHSARLLSECRSFVAGQRGQTGAANGSHDDLVMAMAVAQSVRSELLVRR